MSISTNAPKLMQLAIPRGWAVGDNKFYDVDPVVEPGSDFITNAFEGFIMDTLWIFEFRFEKEQFIIPEFNHYSISLGWSPDSRIIGEYGLQLDWYGVEERISVDSMFSRNRYKIRDKMEEWMYDIMANYKSAHSRFLK